MSRGQMILRQSRFVHAIPLSEDRLLIVHAVSHLRLTVDDEVGRILDVFALPRRLPDDVARLAAEIGYSVETLAGCVASLLERGFLTDKSPEAELEATAAQLAPLHGRDPDDRLEAYRRGKKAGADPYWSVSAAHAVRDLAGAEHRLDVLLFGDCDLQMEADFLRSDGMRRGVELRIATSFPDDVRFASERRHDAVVIGALRSRRTICDVEPPQDDAPPHAVYIAEASDILHGLRRRTTAPILIDALPEPTVQPMGFADRGLDGHRNRFRRANLALAALAESFTDVHVVDIPAALAAVGSQRLLDDGLVSFTHFGSPGWMLTRPESEKAAVHGLFPDPAPLAQAVDGDPYGREAIVAAAHMDALVTVLGLDRKKCVVVDLDGVLWPGVLAETGRPFAWDPEISGLYSYAGLYFGIHEALKALKRRGVLLACVSKNDEAVVRELWRYPDHYPLDRLLTPDDFVTWRVNWSDKADNISAIADELGLALDSFVFVDDRDIERENVKSRLPQVHVLGDDLFSLRRSLLSDPRLQVPRVTPESQGRTDLVKSQLDRKRVQAQTPGDASAFTASLNVRCRVTRLSPGDALARVEELFQRTTQFNTTGRRFCVAELAEVASRPRDALFTLHVSDRFGDHGLVGAAVILAGEIVGFAMSCRVIGLGAEHVFMTEIVAALACDHREITAQIIDTPRNAPVRNLYLDNGFALDAGDVWRKAIGAPARLSA